MRLTEAEVLQAVETLTVERLRLWIDMGCVRPADRDTFSEVDVARVRLLCTLADDMNVDEEVLPLVLSLVDQIHGLRAALHDLTRAVQQQSPSVRRDIAQAFRRVREERED